MSDQSKEPFTVQLIRETEASILVDHGAGECWLPKSQIEYDDDAEEGDYMEVEIPIWLAEKEGVC